MVITLDMFCVETRSDPEAKEVVEILTAVFKRSELPLIRFNRGFEVIVHY